MALTDDDWPKLINALRSAPWTADGLVDHVTQELGRLPPVLVRFLPQFLEEFRRKPSRKRLTLFLDTHEPFRLAWGAATRTTIRPCPASMSPHPKAQTWDVPTITTVSELVDVLRIDAHHLDWLADVTGRTARQRSAKLCNYRHRWHRKSDGRARLIEIPKPILRAIHRRILRKILDRIPAHPAAHGFVAGRSVRTNAEVHCGRAVVLGFDLQSFFPSVSTGAVRGVFRTAGYPPEIVNVLTGFCTTHMPGRVWDDRPNPATDGSDHAEYVRLMDRHLPQGAPTSPALANLAAYRLDARLIGLAEALGATYTRYADDLTFSGGEELLARTKCFGEAVGRIVQDEGFRLNAAKTRVRTRAARQMVTGVVVNVRPNRPRAEFDQLKAILTNCLRHGPVSQNRAGHADFHAHLRGRLAHLAGLNPTRGGRLYELFDRIAWPAG